jgi:riboflavin biosynthesis pyrimidine reductase
MRRLLPEPSEEVSPYDAYRPADPAAPLLRLNMVASIEGTVVGEDGRAGTLGAAGDREVFRSLRALADAVLVGAATVRADGYGPHRLRAELAGRRRADGRRDPAAIVVVTRSIDLDLGAPLFTQARVPTVVLTCAAADPLRRGAAERAGRVVVAGEECVDLAAGVAALRRLGFAHVLCEGGPSVNTTLLRLGLVDELCLTVAPTLVGRGLQLAGDLPQRRDLDLVSVLEQDGELFLRYRARQ